MKTVVASLFVLLFAVNAMAAETAVKLETLTGTIHGTLLVAETKAPVPVVLLIAGSGPTDRNGNTPALPGANNSLQMLAEGLAAKGIASLRYDKRGIAASKSAMTSEADLRFETYIDDAAAWVRQLGKDERFSRVYVAGHSEGSLIGIVAAQKGGVAGVISIAGAGRPAADLIRAQVQSRLPAEMLAFTNEALDSLTAQKPVADVPPMLNMLFRPSVQPYLMSWFRYDPAKEIAKLK
ncbi:MAG TPA: alpha/beta hydrolase, partial [Thermoanaerobaculia bacterium]